MTNFSLPILFWRDQEYKLFIEGRLLHTNYEVSGKLNIEPDRIYAGFKCHDGHSWGYRKTLRGPSSETFFHEFGNHTGIQF